MYWVSASNLEELDRVGAPSGNVAGELFQHQHRALAPPERDRVRDLGARAGDSRRNTLYRLVADQVADVRE